ncbi:MAG: class I SAM-dependent methyltransferase [Prolixibacteraceae bacterium]|nr:class I SAM-dependent methyltransferase [Prolixibacteraceae bacterium]MBN2774903.1 class I SAM-dependent methyltransferase [Prolixibacteraceae bacterium]
MAESGSFYKTFIDPLVAGIRKHVVSKINEKENVIDIACGTGAQVFVLAEKASEVVGIDLSESMISTANKESSHKKINNARFYVADATNLNRFREREFDVSTMSLALHQFNPELYPVILKEMKRISSQIIIVDYTSPLPSWIKKLVVNVIEFLAGKEHYGNFKKFNKAGGLHKILSENNMVVTDEKKIGSGIFSLVVCKSLS